MTDMSPLELEAEFARQCRLCHGIGKARMAEILVAVVPDAGEPIGSALRRLNEFRRGIGLEPLP